jgi:DNA-binding CsgD family transcriptional regulator
VQVEELEGAEGGAHQVVHTRALLAVGRLLLSLQGEVARARAALEKALTLAERWSEPSAIVWAHTYLGLAAVVGGQMEEGARLLGEAERDWEVLGDSVGLSETRSYLGLAANATGDATAAVAYYTATLQLVRAVGDPQGAGFVHCYLGVAEWKLGDLQSAAEHFQAAVRAGLVLRDRWLLGYATQAAMALVGPRAEPEQQARLLGAADAWPRATGAMVAWGRPTPGGGDVAGLREQVARERELAAAYRDGRALPFPEAAALTLTLLEETAHSLASPGSAQRPAAWPPSQSLLTGREVEVLRLVALGHSSKEIGNKLFLSPSTVNQHIRSIFNKLGVGTRAQAVAVAAQRGLL